MSDSDDLRIAGEGKLNGQEALAGHGQLLDGEHQNPVVIEEGLESVGAERPLPFLSVAVAASADSAEAYTELFRSLPPDTGMSFVVIPHAVSGRTDDFVDRLVRQTAMPVSEIVEGTALHPDHVYVVPPNRLARLRGGKFHLSGLDSDAADHLAPHQPIDHFFRSLASDQKTRSIGVLLSGSDGGGALGLKAIQGEGGITFVQSPESAPFS
jgi:two-component system CheB/CheR fusion protein